MSDDQFDFWSAEHGAVLRPTPRLLFRVVAQPQPHLGENISVGVKVLHQFHLNMNGGFDVWLPVEMET